MRLKSKSIKIRWFLGIAAALVLILWVLRPYWLRPPSVVVDKGPLATLRIGYAKYPSYGLLLLAQAKDFFEQEGVRVELIPYATGKEASERLKRGEVDLAAAYETPIVQHLLQGQDFIILTELHSSSNHTAIVYRKQRFPNGPHTYTGQKIGLVPGTNAGFLLSLYFRSHLIDPGSAREVGMEPGALAPALTAGELDAAVLWEPDISEIVSSAPEIYGVARTAYYTELSLLVAKRSLAETHSDGISRVLRALHHAQSFMQTHPEAAQRLIEQTLGYNAETAPPEIWDKINLHLGLSSVLLALMTEEARWYSNSRTRDLEPTILRHFDTRFLAEIVPESVTY